MLTSLTVRKSKLKLRGFGQARANPFEPGEAARWGNAFPGDSVAQAFRDDTNLIFGGELPSFTFPKLPTLNCQTSSLRTGTDGKSPKNGFRNDDRYIEAIYHNCGKLPLPPES